MKGGRSHRVEARQLAASGGQCERERLHAVAVKISPSEHVVGVETVVNLADEAGKFVERRRYDRSQSSVGDRTRAWVQQIWRRPGMASEETLDHRVVWCVVRTERPVRCRTGWHVGERYDS